MKYFDWLKPGIYIKRWIIIGIIGGFLICIGIYPYISAFLNENLNSKNFYFVILCAGILIVAVSVWKAICSLLSLLEISNATELLSYKLREKDRLERGSKIVVIGGGTGLSVILRGIKKLTSNITVVVTTMDDGGGSGVLREDLGMLPPGDIRSCILALADTEEDMQELFQYRFKEGRLTGQSFGNLFIAALTGVYESFEKAVAKIHDVLAVKGRVIPVTAEDVTLCAELKNGEVIKGESKIAKGVLSSKSPIKRVYIEPSMVAPLDGVIPAIKDADIIILGPGSLYTSIIPNLLVNDIVDALTEVNSPKIYITNIMTQPGETDDYTVSDHIHAIQRHAGKKVIDAIIVNNEKMPDDILIKYKEDGAVPIYITRKEAKKLKKEGIQIYEDACADIKLGYIRHDADKIAEMITKITKN